MDCPICGSQFTIPIGNGCRHCITCKADMNMDEWDKIVKGGQGRTSKEVKDAAEGCVHVVIMAIVVIAILCAMWGTKT
ncbi:MAG: hypothetical protein WC100_03540 [Sterolibacterium sp.]